MRQQLNSSLARPDKGSVCSEALCFDQVQRLVSSSCHESCVKGSLWVTAVELSTRESCGIGLGMLVGEDEVRRKADAIMHLQSSKVLPRASDRIS